MLRRILPLLVLLSAVTLVAQEYRDQVTVEVVDVPVYVYGDSGPIRNLTRDDFELYVNGKRQTIDYFDPIEESAQASPGAVTPPDPRNRRLFLFLFDFSFTRPAAVKRARNAAMSMVEHALQGDLFAVATAGNSGLHFLSAFSGDRAVVMRALRGLSPSAAHDPLAIAITNLERDWQTPGSTVGSATGLSGHHDFDADAELAETLARWGRRPAPRSHGRRATRSTIWPR
jgi:VWFA-related protein